jgi:hypothetical protein
MSIASEVAVPKVIREQKDDVWRAIRSSAHVSEENEGHERQ